MALNLSGRTTCMATELGPKQQTRILFIDAYDSFSENIIALLRQFLHATVLSLKIDDPITTSRGERQNLPLACFDAIVIGPGPGSPDSASDTGHLDEIWEQAAKSSIPVLGICLGFQSLCSRFGLPVVQLLLPCHGHARDVLHGDEDIFKDLGRVVATSYNSLAVRLPQLNGTSTPASSASSRSGVSRPSSSCSSLLSIDQMNVELDAGGSSFKFPLKVLAWNKNNYVMAVKHTHLPFWGLQFHPESCLSNSACQTLLTNWWRKVYHHNKEFRIISPMPPQDPLAKTANDSNTSAMEISALTRHLEEVTQHCAQVVSYSLSNSAVSRIQLANLCQALSAEGTTAMLESSRRGRFSIYPITDSETWQMRQSGDACQIQRNGRLHHTLRMSIDTTMKAIEAFMSEHIATGGDPNIPFWGGLLGFVSYEAGLELAMPEHHRSGSCRTSRTVPDLNLIWIDRSLVHDNETGRLYIQTLRKTDNAWLSEISARVKALATNCNTESFSAAMDDNVLSATTNMPSHPDYISRMRSCQANLHVGNSYELCLTTSATVTISSRASSSYSLYRSLQHQNPAPYSAYISLDTTTLLSSSPEQFLSWPRSTPHLDMMPMKGTVPKSPDLTRQQAKEMLRTPKEEAEKPYDRGPHPARSTQISCSGGNG